MDFQEALQHAIDGNAALFVGSGFSKGATPLDGEDFLTGRELAKRLYRESGIEPAPDDDLAYASQRFRKNRQNDSELIQLLERLYTATNVSSLHRRMPEISWSHIYTTNYDNVLELAYLLEKKKLVPVTTDKDGRDYVMKRNVCVHINGFIDDLSPATLNGSFKLTNASYLTESFLASNWSFMFRRAIENARAIFFIGYSMYDLHIQRIVYQSEASKAKTFFIEDSAISPSAVPDLFQSEFGKVLPIGLSGFWEEFDRVKATYQPRSLGRVLNSFDEWSSPSHQGFRDDYVFDLLLKGQMRVEHVFEEIVHPKSAPPYFVRRQEHDRVIEALNRGRHDVIVHSDIANGKSSFLVGIASDAIRQGFRVFWLKDSAEQPATEIDAICELSGRVIVIIENYARRIEDIRHLSLRRPDTLSLVLSSRSSLHDYAIDELEDLVSTRQVLQFRLDVLTDVDLLKTSTILDSYKFWGARDALPDWKKQRYLKQDCSSEWRSILLDIVRSPDVLERFKPLFESFRENNELSQVLITASALKLLGITSPSEEMVSDLLDSTYLFSVDFRRNRYVQQLASVEGRSIIPRSSVLARFGLTEFADPKTVVETLVRITKRAHDIARDFDSRVYFGLYRDLVTFSQVQSMLPEKGKRDLLIRFYESIKNLPRAQNHPHFWLQYAMARLAYADKENLERAKFFLDSAYAQAAKRPNYHTRHLDNVYARYLVEHAKISPLISDALLELNDAHIILLREAQEEKNEVAFKVARLYLTFYTARKTELDQTGRALMQRHSAQMLEQLGRLPPELLTQDAVVKCKADLELLLRELAIKH